MEDKLMLKSLSKGFTAVALAGLVVLGLGFLSVAYPFQVTGVSLTATPSDYKGPCPVTIKFDGKIAVDGKGTVTYTFLRSDGATGPSYTLTFETAGSKPVSTTWTLGGPGFTYAGWEAIAIQAPIAQTPPAGQANFKVACSQPTRQPTGQLPDITSKKGITIGGAVGGAGGKFAPWGGTINLTQADSFLQSGGKCAFNISYDMVNTGPVPTSPAFGNRLRSGADVVSHQSSLALNTGETKQINTQAYLPPGSQVVSLSLDDDHVVTESNEGNNVFRVQVILDAKCAK